MTAKGKKLFEYVTTQFLSFHEGIIDVGTMICAMLILFLLYNTPTSHPQYGSVHQFFYHDHRQNVMKNACPPDNFAFYVRSGMANIIGPKISFNGKTVMSNVYNNVGTGLNVVLVSAESGMIEDVGFFNMYSEKVDPLLLFLKKIKKSTIVLLASFDNPVTRMTDEIRETFASLGSYGVKSLSLRDTWIFVGGPGMKELGPFEKVEKNNLKFNVHGGWPGVIAVEGCIPKR